MVIKNLEITLDTFHLLKHQFYKNWSEGKLSIDTLKHYAEQYYHHVDAFPRYISTIHSQCEDLPSRQILLANLNDEEQGRENHPELWLRFAEKLGTSREKVKNATKLENTQDLIDGYFNLTKKSYATGLGALYAYERQVPDVAKSKIDGLKKFYDMDSEEGLKFFNVHITADEWHSTEISDLMKKLPIEQQAESFDGAVQGAKLLWQFLDGIDATCQ